MADKETVILTFMQAPPGTLRTLYIVCSYDSTGESISTEARSGDTIEIEVNAAHSYFVAITMGYFGKPIGAKLPPGGVYLVESSYNGIMRGYQPKISRIR